jgi:hypothetical protein
LQRTPSGLFWNASSSKAAVVYHHTARTFWRKFDGGSALAKNQKFIKAKGGFMLQDSPVVPLQSVPVRLVWCYWNHAQHAPASAPPLHCRLPLLLRVAVVTFPAVLCTKMRSSIEISSMQK